MKTGPRVPSYRNDLSTAKRVVQMSVSRKHQSSVMVDLAVQAIVAADPGMERDALMRQFVDNLSKELNADALFELLGAGGGNHVRDLYLP